MTITTFLRGLGRRWYLVLAGLLVSAALAVMAFSNANLIYERSASQLLVPASQTVPEGGNPFLYLGGLGQASDVLVVALKADAVQTPITDRFPGTTITIGRDATTSGPIIVVDVEGDDDANVAGAFEAIVAEIPTALTDLQNVANVQDDARISVLPLTADTDSTTSQKQKIQAAGLIGVAGLAVTVLLVALIDGLLMSRRSRIKRRKAQAVQFPAVRSPKAVAVAPSSEAEADVREKDVETRKTARPRYVLSADRADSDRLVRTGSIPTRSTHDDD